MKKSRSQKNRTLVIVLALLTFPVSLPYFAVKTLRRKRKKAEARRSIAAMDAAPKASLLRDAEGDLPLLSVIMPVYNIGEYLEASIISVLNQSYSNLELIIVNDASTDHSLSVARMFEKIDPRVRVIDLPFNTPGGAGVPSNIGVEQARGDFIGFVDGDDFLTSFAFERLMQAALTHDCDLAVGYFKTFLTDTREISEPYDLTSFSQLPADVPFRVADHPASLQISAVPWRKLYKRAFLQEHRVSFPEGDVFFEDNPLHWDAMTAAESVVVVRGTIAYHRMNREGQTNAASAPKLAAYFAHFASISANIRKNGADFAWLPFLEFVERMDWIIQRQTDPLLVEQFKLRFRQTVDEWIAPHMEGSGARALDKARGRFETERTAPELSVLLYHDGDTASDADLARTISSVRAMRDRTVEIILLHSGAAPDPQPDWGAVIFIPVAAHKYRAYNQALSLCAGEQMIFLGSGDKLSPQTVERLLAADAPNTDVIFSELPNRNTWHTSRLLLIGRRVVQDRGLFFGKSSCGWMSFQHLSEAFAETRQTISSEIVSFADPMGMSTDLSCLEHEAYAVARNLKQIEGDNQKVFQSISIFQEFLDRLENAVGKDELSNIRRARMQFACHFEDPAGQKSER